MHCNDFNPKFTGSLVTRLSCYKVPGVLQVEIVENVVFNIRLVVSEVVPLGMTQISLWTSQ